MPTLVGFVVGYLCGAGTIVLALMVGARLRELAASYPVHRVDEPDPIESYPTSRLRVLP